MHLKVDILLEDIYISTYMAPCFHTYGVRIKQHTGQANLMENFADHRIVSWKGSKPTHILHPTHALKLKPLTTKVH